MAAPLQTAKPTVNLAGKAVPGSRIRRDPPPVPKKTVIPDRNEQDRRTVPIAIVTFTLALVIVIVAVGSWAGWTPRQYTLELDDRGGL